MSESDSKVVSDVLKGNKEAFEVLVRKYDRKLFNLACRITGDHEAAMDITQNSFIKAYDRLADFDPSYKFFSWIYRIATNESLNFLKKSRQTVNIDGLSPFKSRVSDIPGPEDEMIKNENEHMVQNALMKIREDSRVVLIMKYFIDLSYSEICEILSIPEKTVKSRLYSARQEIKNILTG